MGTNLADWSHRHASVLRAVAGALVAGLAVSAPHLAAEEPPALVRAEVQHLLAFLRGSDCHFLRNGQWYGAEDAARHLERKYKYLVKRDRVRSTEDFIGLAATRSSISGEPYQVRCEGHAPVPGGDWLSEELTRYRAGSATGSKR